MLLAKRNRALLGRLHGSDRLLRRATFNFMPDEPSSLAVHIAIHLHDQGWTHPPVDRTDEGYKQFYLNMARTIDRAIELSKPITRNEDRNE